MGSATKGCSIRRTVVSMASTADDIKRNNIVLPCAEDIWEGLSKETKTTELLAQSANGMYGMVAKMIDYEDNAKVSNEKHYGSGRDFVRAADYDNRTALHLAASRGNKDIAILLVNKGADVNAEDAFGGTPIEDASRGRCDDQKKREMMEFLKKNGAKTRDIDTKKLKMIKLASQGDVEGMQELQDVLNLVKDGQNPEEGVHYDEPDMLVNCADYDGRTPLHVAAQGGYLKAVEWLRDNKARIVKDAFGQTPLDDAARTKARFGSDAVLDMLQNRWPSEQVEGHDEDGESTGNPLFWKLFLAIQVVIIILYGTCVKYDNSILQGSPNASTYRLFQDVHVMIFVGFGFLMTFLRKYGFSSVGLNFAVACLAIQWHILVGSFSHQWCTYGFHGDDWHSIRLNLQSFLLADFATATVLITFGALLGKVSPTQLLVLAMWELLVFSFNECISVTSWHVSDMGGSMVVHVFGAYFGLAASWVLTTPAATKRSENSSDYRSDLFAMIGTLFLWVFWPSFTGSPASSYSQERVVVNTLLALVGSALTGFCFSAWLRGENKFDMVDIQNATLAGGVAIGTSCDMYITPAGALTVGACYPTY